MGSSHRTAFVKDQLDFLENSGLYRHLRTVVPRGPMANVDGKEVINLCSNDYLGLSQNKQVIKKTITALNEEVSQCGSRLIAGNHPKLTELEGLLACHRRTESALLYPTGYTANLGVVTTVADKNSTIFSDELNHASIVDACRLSGATIVVFRHNDTDHLQEQMGRGRGRKIVITEGIFSMDGDMGKLSEIKSIADDHGAITIIDDAHGDFVFGPGFSGMPAKMRVNFDIHVSSMSKALGCFGGYVATTFPIRELLINTSRQFIYTSALPDHLCSAAITALPIAKSGYLQKRLQWNVLYFFKEIKRLGFEVANSSSQIVPIIVGKEAQALELSKELLERGVFAQAIRYPTVKKGHARLRISLNAMHRKRHLDFSLSALERAGKKTGIL
ncbi:MAG TPA: aminotransferase class I/II-fold pyridoxal phosphate-dependent enzyme [Nitrososphaera sp.]|nr:aminotransferase class I/II-fold pyridoxal phosphate-dependent enzyme [Nitrososphaera sp.]